MAAGVLFFVCMIDYSTPFFKKKGIFKKIPFNLAFVRGRPRMKAPASPREKKPSGGCTPGGTTTPPGVIIDHCS